MIWLLILKQLILKTKFKLIFAEKLQKVEENKMQNTLDSSGDNNPYQFPADLDAYLKEIQRQWESVVLSTIKRDYPKLYQVLIFSCPIKVFPPNPSAGVSVPKVLIALNSMEASLHLLTHCADASYVTDLLSDVLYRSVQVTYFFSPTGNQLIHPATKLDDRYDYFNQLQYMRGRFATLPDDQVVMLCQMTTAQLAKLAELVGKYDAKRDNQKTGA